MEREGVIKFNCILLDAPPPDYRLIIELNKCRDKLYANNLIGMDENGIGFGNLSIRYYGNRFFISSSQSGNIEYLTNEYYTLAVETNFNRNQVICIGKHKASSESLTHSIIYQLFPLINAVIHIHSNPIWEFMLGKNKNTPQYYPATGYEAGYGSIDLVDNIQRLARETNLLKKKIIVLPGHQDGIIIFGKNIKQAAKFTLDLVMKIIKSK